MEEKLQEREEKALTDSLQYTNKEEGPDWLITIHS